MVTPPTVNQISGQGGDHYGPVMSADGHYIVYDPDGSIFLYNHQTHTTVTVAEAGDGFSYSGQTISADGRYVVFQGTNGSQSYVYIYNNDPSDLAHYKQTTQLAAGGAPAVSGDGSRIVIEHGGNSIGIYDQLGHVIATVTAAAIGETGSVWLPAVSADGHLIAFWQTDAAAPGGSGHLFVYDLSTGTVDRDRQHGDRRRQQPRLRSAPTAAMSSIKATRRAAIRKSISTISPPVRSCSTPPMRRAPAIIR